MPVETKENVSSWHIYVVRVKDKGVRDDLMTYLYKNGIGVNFHYPAVYSHPYYRENGYKNVELKNEEEYHGACVTLPCHISLKKQDVQKVVDLIKIFFLKKTKVVGRNIYLRQLVMNDASQKYCNWLKDKKVNKHLETHNTTVKELEDYIALRNSRMDSVFFGIFDKKNNTHIGNFKLEPIDWKKREAVFGILIGDKSCWGKGVGTEVTKLAVDYSFKNLNLKSVNLGVVSENLAAVRVYKKVGFKVTSVQEKRSGSKMKRYIQMKITKK